MRGRISSLALCGDGTLCSAGFSDSTLRVYDLTGQGLHDLRTMD